MTGDPFVVAASTALGTTNIISAATTGEINYPLQPAFFATQSGTIADQTGDGTTYTIVFDLEVFDQNADFNTTTGTFTAPATGRYDLKYNILAQQAVATMSINSALVTSNRTINSSVGLAVTGNNMSVFSALVDMDTNDTATVTIQYSGGTKVVDIYGASTADPRTNFSGFLAC